MKKIVLHPVQDEATAYDAIIDTTISLWDKYQTQAKRFGLDAPCTRTARSHWFGAMQALKAAQLEGRYVDRLCARDRQQICLLS